MNCATATRSPERSPRARPRTHCLNTSCQSLSTVSGAKTSTANTVSAIATSRSAAVSWSASRNGDFSLVRQGNDPSRYLGECGPGVRPESSQEPAAVGWAWTSATGVWSGRPPAHVGKPLPGRRSGGADVPRASRAAHRRRSASRRLRRFLVAISDEAQDPDVQ
jgi:hypothetical protein